MCFTEIAAVICTVVFIAWLIVTSGLFVFGIIAAAIMTAHAWEEWGDREEKKEKENRDNAEF